MTKIWKNFKLIVISVGWSVPTPLFELRGASPDRRRPESRRMIGDDGALGERALPAIDRDFRLTQVFEQVVWKIT